MHHGCMVEFDENFFGRRSKDDSARQARLNKESDLKRAMREEAIDASIKRSQDHMDSVEAASKQMKDLDAPKSDRPDDVVIELAERLKKLSRGEKR